MLKRLQLGIALAVLVGLIVMPAPVAAQEPTFVFPLGLFFPDGCLIFGPTVETIPIVTGWAWVAKNRGLVQALINAVDFTFSLDGVPIADPDQWWGPIFNFGDWDGDGKDDFAAFWEYPVGLLSPGDYSFSYVYTQHHRIPDLLVFEDEENRRYPVLYEPVTSELDCTISVT